MALDKAIQHGKERRRPYRKSKAFDGSCRNHGQCAWCREGRQHADKKRREAARIDLEEAGRADE